MKSKYLRGIHLGHCLYIIAAFSGGIVLSETQIKLFHASNAPKWPNTFAPEIPSSVVISSSATFTWEFHNDPNGNCVSNGKPNIKPCVGRVVDYTFSKSGKQSVKLTIKDGSKKPIEIQQTVEVPELNQMGKAIRPEIRALDDAWSKRWLDALYRLKDNGVYDHLAKIHFESFSVGVSAGAGQRSVAHSSPSFATWHRMSIRVVERCLGAAAEDYTMGVPYWDWMKGWNGMEKFFGGDGSASNGYVIADGPYCNDPKQQKSAKCPKRWILPADFDSDVKALKRQLNSDPGFHFLTQTELDGMLNIPNYDLPPFSDKPTKDSFRNALEGWLSQEDTSKGYNHNGVHRWLGGTMKDVVSSFHDPVFLVHHSQVDRLVTMWQDKQSCADGKGSSKCYRPGQTDPGVTASLAGSKQVTKDGKSVYVLEGHMYGDTLFPWGISNKDLLAARQGYDFLKSGEKPPQLKAKGTVATKKSSAAIVNASLLMTFVAVMLSLIL